MERMLTLTSYPSVFFCNHPKGDYLLKSRVIFGVIFPNLLLYENKVW